MKEGVVKFKVNEEYCTVGGDIPPETTLLTYLRDTLRLKGTKYMCQEGGCGACIVGVKRPNPITKKEEIFAVNSCLLPLLVCHGWSFITVENVGGRINGFSKEQAVLAGFSGTQCGYCSPGMVMNMHCLLQGKEKVTMQDVENSFGGNMCRCTGYRPILDAFKSLTSDATPELKQTCVDIEDMMKELKLCPKTKEICSSICNTNKVASCESALNLLPKESFSLRLPGNVVWIKVKEVPEIFDVFKKFDDKDTYMLVSGRTSHGVYRIKEMPHWLIDVNDVDELHSFRQYPDKIVLGANMSLTSAMDMCYKVAKEEPEKFAYLKQLADHMDLIASLPVRNVASLAGNVSIKHAHPEFPSDLFVILEAVGANVIIRQESEAFHSYPLMGYLELDMRKRVIFSFSLPAYDSTYVFSSYKIMQRAQNTHAYVNAGFFFNVDKKDKFRVQKCPNIVFGGLMDWFIHASRTEVFLINRQLLDINVVKEACKILQGEIKTDNDPLEASAEYRRSLAVNLLYKFILSLFPDSISPKNRSGGSVLQRPISSGKQDFQTNKSMWPVSKPIPKLEAFLQCSGEAEYVNDMLTPPETLYASFVLSRVGPGVLKTIDTSVAEKMPEFVKFIRASDIPGKNSFVESYKTEDEELLVSSHVRFAGQPVGIVVAKTQAAANKAAELVVVNVNVTEKAVIDMVKIVESGDQSRISKHAEKKAEKTKDDVKYKINGTFRIGGQYHYTMETQTCYCVPTEDGMDIYPSSQWITVVQHNAAAALNLPDNSINVSVKRCGGGYGSKLGRSALVSTACAVAADNCRKPVMMVMPLETNMEAVGKRFPLYAKYETGVNKNGEIQFLKLETYSDHGAANNDSLFGGIVSHSQSCYESSTWHIIQNDVITDYVPNTYARSPGSVEGVSLIELIMEHIAQVTKLDPVAVRLANLSPKHSDAIPWMLSDVKLNSDFERRKLEVEKFNKENRWKKRGITLVMMNYPYSIGINYHALLSVYGSDGTVAISHGGVEIGQGVNTKVAQAAAYTLGIDLNSIKVKPTSVLTAPNDGPTGGSMASDAVCIATIECCKILLGRLQPIKEKNPGIKWKDLISKAAAENIDLCVEYMYSPNQTPCSYNIYGITITEVEVDMLTGQYQILKVDLLEDVGQSMSPSVDIGQVEGAFVMGLGYWLTEKLIYDQDSGACLTNRTWNYTPPGAKDIPIDFRVYFRRNAPNSLGVLRSKATGEPPLCMAVSVIFAIRNALASARQDATGKDDWFDIKLPYTPENVLLSTLTSIDQFSL